MREIIGAAPGRPYSRGTRCGNMVFVSGQLGWDANDDPVPGGAGPQTRQALEYVKEVLALAGASLDDVTMVNVYLDDLDRDYDAMNEVYRSTSAVTGCRHAPPSGCRAWPRGCWWRSPASPSPVPRRSSSDWTPSSRSDLCGPSELVRGRQRQHSTGRYTCRRPAVPVATGDLVPCPLPMPPDIMVGGRELVVGAVHESGPVCVSVINMKGGVGQDHDCGVAVSRGGASAPVFRAGLAKSWRLTWIRKRTDHESERANGHTSLSRTRIRIRGSRAITS